MRKPKGWHTLIAPYRMDARKSDGRHAGQIRVMVAETSKRAAADRFGISLHAFNLFASEVSDADMGELAKHTPGTVLAGPLDRGDTIDGTTGWRRMDPQPPRFHQD